MIHMKNILLESHPLGNIFSLSNFVCLQFFSQIKISSMQVQDVPKLLLPGEPYSAPSNVVTVEATISLLRTLSMCKVNRLAHCAIKSPSPEANITPVIERDRLVTIH